MSAVYNSTVQGFYLSYYGRPADPAGLTFWTGQLAAAGGNLSAILDAFGTSAEATRRYGTGTNASKIEAIYQQTFGRAADPVGLAFYEGEIAAGRMTLINASKRIIDGAAGDDIAVRTNRLSAAQSFTDKLDTAAEQAGYSGVGAEDAARAWITTVTKDAATVTAAVATADSTITSLLPQAFTLTTSADKWTGSAGNDSVSGGTSALAASNTLGVTDQIDGGAGTDSISLGIGAAFAGFSGGGFLKNVENVKLTASVANTTFTAKGVTGVTQYDLVGHTNLASVDSTAARINVSGISTDASTVSLGFIDEATTGSSTALTVGVSGLGAVSSTTGLATATITVTTPGVEALTLDANGTLAVVNIGSTGVTSLTGTGSGPLRLTSVAASGLKTVNGSAMKGVLDIDLQNATSVTSLKGGEGADVFRLDDASITATAVVEGGAGSDTLRLDATGAAPILAPKMTSVETVRIGNVAHNVTLSLSDSTGVTSIYVAKEADAAITSTITGLGSAEANVTIQAESSSAEAHTVSVENTGAAKVSLATSASAVSASTVESTTDSATLTKATSLDVTVSEFARWTSGTITAAEATAITVSGAGDFGETAAGVTVAGAKAATLTLDQSSTSAAWDIQYTKGTATTSPLRTLNVTSKSTTAPDFNTTTDLAAKLQTLNFTTLAGSLDLSATNFAEIATVNVAGSGSSAALKLGNLGASDLGYGISVTASGLAGTNGLGLGNILVGTGQNISLDIGKVTGPGSIGNLTSAASTSGTVTVAASGFGAGTTAQNLSIGNIQGGTVSVDLTGAKGTSSVGTIAGNAVSVLASTAEAAVTVGDITAKNSLTFEARTAQATTETFNTGSSSTAFTGSIRGSIADDSFTLNSTQTGQTSITLTGDLRDGTNTLTVSSTASTASGGLTIDISGMSNVTSSTLSGAWQTKNVIKGGAGADTIRGGTKADLMTGGAGKDIFSLNNLADTGTVTVSELATSSKFAASKSISTTDLDVITDFGANDTLRINGLDANSSSIATSDRVVYGTTSSTITGTEVLLSGTYSSSANTFTTASAGADALYIYDVSGTSRAIVLVGFGTGFTAVDANGSTAGAITGLLGTST